MTWKILSILCIVLPLCVALGQADLPNGSSDVTTGGALEKDALKDELKAGDADKALRRLEQWAANDPGHGSDAFKLCQGFLELQSAGEWQEHREVLDHVVRTKLGDFKEDLPESLTKLQGQEAQLVVVMGKLYEERLYDKQSAVQCYTVVMRRLLKGMEIPDKIEDWRGLLAKAEFPSDLSAEEKYAIRRLEALSDEKEVTLRRIADRLDQKILASEQALNPQQAVDPFVPNLPLDELRRRHLEGMGSSQ